MGESGRGFGLEVMRKSKLKKTKKKKQKCWNIMVPNFLYSNNYHFLNSIIVVVVII